MIPVCQVVMETLQEKRARHLLALRARGLTDSSLLSAIEQIPRENFVPSRWQTDVYAGRSLPLPCGQDMTPAVQVAQTADALRLDASCRVLELCSGSG